MICIFCEEVFSNPISHDEEIGAQTSLKVTRAAIKGGSNNGRAHNPASERPLSMLWRWLCTYGLKFRVYNMNFSQHTSHNTALVLQKTTEVKVVMSIMFSWQFCMLQPLLSHIIIWIFNSTLTTYLRGSSP